MSGTKFLEDHILLHLLANAKKDESVPKAAFAEYRRAYTYLFNEELRAPNHQSSKLLFKDAFLEFWYEVEHAKIKAPLERKLFNYLLEHILIARAENRTPMQGQKRGKAQKKPLKYLESEILVQLIRRRHDPTKNQLSKVFRGPIINILKKRYGSMYHDPGEVYGIAIADGILYIEEGKLQSRIKSRLLTFFTRITQYKLINDFKKETSRQSKIISLDEPNYIDALLKSPEDAIYATLDAENDANDVLLYRGVTRKQLSEALTKLKPIQRRYLEMYAIQKMSYREMAEELYEETGEEKTENALRKAIFDTLKKARKALNLKKNEK